MTKKTDKSDSADADRDVANAVLLRSMAEKLHAVAEQLSEAADFLSDHKLDCYPTVSTRTANTRVEQLRAFSRKLKMHKEKREDAVREAALDYELNRRNKHD